MQTIELDLFLQIERANLERKLGNEINPCFLKEMLFLGFNFNEIEFILTH